MGHSFNETNRNINNGVKDKARYCQYDLILQVSVLPCTVAFKFHPLLNTLKKNSYSIQVRFIVLFQSVLSILRFYMCLNISVYLNFIFTPAIGRTC